MVFGKLRPSVLLGLMLCCEFTICSGRAAVSVFQPQDSSQIDALFMEIGRIERDLLEAARPIMFQTTGECLVSIENSLAIFDQRLVTIGMLINIERSMISDIDDDVVRRFSRGALSSGLDSIVSARRSINYYTGVCGFSPLVVERTNSVLPLLDQGPRLLEGLNNRLSQEQHP